MDARIAQLQQELKERDGEINRLQTEQRVRDKTTMKKGYIIIMIFMYVQAQTTSGDKSEYVPAMQHPPQKPQVTFEFTMEYSSIVNVQRNKWQLY